MKVLPYFHGHFGPLIKPLISSSIGDDIVPLVAVHATRALNNHPINSTIFFTCNLRFSNTPGQDSGFPVPSNSQESPEWTWTKRTWSDCRSVRQTCRNTS